MSSRSLLQSIATAASTVTPAAVTVTVTASPPAQIYFENSWSVLSSTALLLLLGGILVILMIGLSALSVVPVVVSAGASVGNGLCYYAFYSDYSWHAEMVAGVIADIGWGVQEIGLPFYSY